MAETVELAAEATADLAEGFKMTKLGPLPREWEVKQFNNVVDEIMAGDWGQDNPDNGLAPCRVLRGTDFARATRNDVSNVPIRYMRSSSIERRRLRPGDVLVELSGGSADQPTGRVLLVTHGLLNASELPVLFSNFVKRIRTSPQCIPEYFVLFWRYLYELGVTRMYEKRTTGIRNFKLADFLTNELIAIPPLSEQRAIAHVLRIVQRAKDATERVLTAVRELKKSLMRYLFTYGPVPVEEAERVPLKETEIGLVPEHWEVVTLGSVVTLKLGRTPARAVSRYWENGEIPWVAISDLNNSIVESTREQISKIALEEVFGGWLAPAGTLLLSFKLTVGKVGILGIPATHNEAIVSVFPRGGVETSFLFYLFQAMDFEFYLDTYVKGKTLNKDKLTQILIPLPPVSEQHKIASILQSVDRKIATEEQQRIALEALFNTLLYGLMTARIRLPGVLVGRFAEALSDGSFQRTGRGMEE